MNAQTKVWLEAQAQAHLITEGGFEWEGEIDFGDQRRRREMLDMMVSFAEKVAAEPRVCPDCGEAVEIRGR